MNRYQLLVIDDELNRRQPGYERVFGAGDRFDLEFCATPDRLLQTIHETPAHGYVVDVRLWPGTDYFQTAMNEISKKHRPVMLLSSRWSERETLDLLSRLAADQRAQIRYFIAWDDHWDVESGDLVEPMAISTCSNVRLSLDQHYQRSAQPPPEDQPVSVLHIADLQFGDPDTAADSFLDENELADSIRRHGVSFVALTGDVAYSGHPDEYGQAEQWLRRLSERLWPGKGMADHLLVVPGNHDVDLRCCAAGRHDYQFPKSTKAKWKLVARAAPATPYPGLGHFREFLHRLTDDHTWLRPDVALSRCQDRFLGFGVRFIHLASSQSATVDVPDRCELNENVLRALVDDVEQKDKLEDADSLFTLVLSHHGFPNHEPGRQYTGFENGEVVTRFLDRVQADMLLFGHGHGMIARQRQANPLCGLVEVMAPALRLKQKLRQEDELRGFNIITFARSCGRVSGIEVTPYEIRAGKVRGRPAEGQLLWKPRRQFCEDLSLRR